MKAQVINSPKRAYEHFEPLLVSDVEEVWAVALTSHKSAIATGMIFRGTVNQCLFHPRDIFRFALQHNAASILIAHNHPSGDPKPSVEDREITKRMIKIGQLFSIPLDDHLILGGAGRFYSFAEETNYFQSDSEAAS